MAGRFGYLDDGEVGLSRVPRPTDRLLWQTVPHEEAHRRVILVEDGRTGRYCAHVCDPFRPPLRFWSVIQAMQDTVLT